MVRRECVIHTRESGSTRLRFHLVRFDASQVNFSRLVNSALLDVLISDPQFDEVIVTCRRPYVRLQDRAQRRAQLRARIRGRIHRNRR